MRNAPTVTISKAEYEYLLGIVGADGLRIAAMEAEIQRLQQELAKALEGTPCQNTATEKSP